MNIKEYVNRQYEGASDWFVDEVDNYYNKNRINDVLNVKDYLQGKHSILDRQVEEWNGQKYFPTIILLNYARNVINFHTSYLLSNPIQIIGNSDVVEVFNHLYKKGNYDDIDFKLYEGLLKFGNQYEYVYLNDDDIITSYLIDPADSFPVFDDRNNYIAFIEFFIVNGISHYIVFYDDAVEEWTDEGGSLHLVNRYNNISGLPIHIKNNLNEHDDNFGDSFIKEWVNIIDLMEKIISKHYDVIFKQASPIGVVSGQKLGDGGLNANLVGNAINLEYGSDFKYVSPDLNENAVKGLFNTLKMSLLDIANVPAIAMNNSQSISNVSETSVKLLFNIANLFAHLNSRFLKQGIKQRLHKMRKLLALNDVIISNEDMDSLDIVFTTAQPQNTQETIENLKMLKEIDAISIESLVDLNPLIKNKSEELERLQGELNDTDTINDIK